MKPIDGTLIGMLTAQNLTGILAARRIQNMNSIEYTSDFLLFMKYLIFVIDALVIFWIIFLIVKER